LKLAEIVSIKPKTALTIIDEVKTAVSRWSKFADESEVGSKSSKNIATTLNKILTIK